MRKCFDGKRSPNLRSWIRRSVPILPRRGLGDVATELDVAVKISSEVEKTPAAAPLGQLDNDDDQELGHDGGQQEELLSTHGLPLSPLMNPQLIAARNRHRAPKPQPSGPPSALRQKLQKNPYAQALATPIRECNLTGARLPSAFLLDFGLAKHPETGKPWHLPEVALASTPSSRKPKQEDTNPSAETTLRPETTISTPQPISPIRNPRIRTASHTHFLAHAPVLQFFTNLKNKDRMRVLPHRWKTDSGIHAQSLVWRKDMDTFVLEALRKKVAKLLAYLSARRAAYIVPCKGYDAVKSSHQVAAVLYLGTPLSPSQMDPNESSPSSPPLAADPPFYAMLPYKAHHIPIYNLPTLLGETHLQQLRESSPAFFGGDMAVLKGKRGTVKAQGELWRLMGFLGFPAGGGGGGGGGGG